MPSCSVRFCSQSQAQRQCVHPIQSGLAHGNAPTPSLTFARFSLGGHCFEFSPNGGADETRVLKSRGHLTPIAKKWHSMP